MAILLLVGIIPVGVAAAAAKVGFFMLPRRFRKVRSNTLRCVAFPLVATAEDAGFLRISYGFLLGMMALRLLLFLSRLVTWRTVVSTWLRRR